MSVVDILVDILLVFFSMCVPMNVRDVFCVVFGSVCECVFNMIYIVLYADLPFIYQ